MRHISLVAYNLRSTHNVGSLLRTAEGLGVEHVYLTGYTPYPFVRADSRLPHIAAKLDKQIRKTALGAEAHVVITHNEDTLPVIAKLKADGYQIIALEQDSSSQSLQNFQPTDKIVLIVGNEVAGLPTEVLQSADTIIEIPMFGEKESFNVVQAAAMAMYHVRFTT